MFGALVVGASLTVAGCTIAPTQVARPSEAAPKPSPTNAAADTGDAQWVRANSLYAEAVCPTNAAREELYEALDTNDIAQLAPVAASASSAFDAAADVFLENSWPAEIEVDIHFLGETSAQLAESWGAVAASADMTAANAVGFPDAQTPYEAAQRIRKTLDEHGQESAGC
ncbi:hypothetical protein N1031_05090 [Herbiconiux moechotypicola]|uniref:Lipoprotein n=2 Tax=Herbiconiux moechotypicola TaxID=637393 RepID=A0ABP5Q6M5_9MICO|nr:hypothetical protein [Herbiconiux moechotypicola]MCS5729129.1 hypothetical protein [Herbiconiux moechotypicola]